MEITIRPAVESDVPQIHAIFTHYVLNSVLTFLQNVPPQKHTADRLAGVKARGLPFLVAVEARNDGDCGDEASNKVLGYASVSPFRGYMLSYASTVELSLFLDPPYQSRGLGTKLLPSIIDELKTACHMAGEYIGDPDHQVLAEGGAGSSIRNLLAVMAIDTDGKEAGEGLRNWYIKRNFVERGRMVEVGFKKGRWFVYSSMSVAFADGHRIDTIYLQYTLC